MASPLRKFGTDLLNARVVKADKQKKKKNIITAATPKARKTQNNEAALVINYETSTKTPESSSSASSGKSDYSVHFTAGPLGMKLEPVVKSIMGRELGCRVVDFIDDLSHNIKSQARLASIISIGDVITAIDGVQVLSKNYSEIVAMLKTASVNGGR
mmetsp:Transcript_15438/g.22812  ORF Transcript_15438/g.22812 Transcript_15438/m.22812 type:complete len:157 (+) Transcript_15438:118-588(+)